MDMIYWGADVLAVDSGTPSPNDVPND